MGKKISGFIVLLVLSLVLAASSIWAADPDTLVILRQLESNNFDPHRTVAQAGTESLFMMADTLVALDYDKKNVVPSLAKSWEVSQDGKTYTFLLREDVTFHSGRKMTAGDVVYSFKRCLGLIDPKIKSPVKARLSDIKEVRAKGDYAVEVEFNTPYNEFLQQLTLFVGMIIDKEVAEKLGPDFGIKGFGGTGPYMWVSWRPQGDLVLKRNPNYKWGPSIYANPGPAKIETVIWRTVPEESTRVAAMVAGQADITYYVPKWALKQLQAAPTLNVSKVEPYYWVVFMGFKVNKPMVSDPKVRQAIIAAVDLKSLVENIYFNAARAPDAHYDKRARDFDPEVLKIFPKYDPELSKKLLDEAGWKMGSDGFRYKDGQKLSVLFYGSTPAYAKPLEAVQGFLRKVGVELKIQLFPGTAVWAKLATQEFDCYGMGFPYFSVGEGLDGYFRSGNIPTPNRHNWNDPETDKLLVEGKSALTEEARFAAFSKVQRKLYNAHVWLPLYFDDMYIAANKRVKGIKPHGLYGSGLYKGLDLEIAK